MRFFFLLLLTLLLVSCKKENQNTSSKEVPQEEIQERVLANRFRESYRSQYHFTPEIAPRFSAIHLVKISSNNPKYLKKITQISIGA